MTFRLSLQGDPELAHVAASIVERLARETGLVEDEARGLAESARGACVRAAGESSACEIAASYRGTRLRLGIVPGNEPGGVVLRAVVARRRGRP